MKLDKNRILELLEEADTKWYNSHSDHPSCQYNYREHLEFTTDHIAKNYDRQSKHTVEGIKKRRAPQASRQEERLL